MIKAYASKKGSYWKEKRPIDIEGEPIIFKKKKQILLGLGGAITKASAGNNSELGQINVTEIHTFIECPVTEFYAVDFVRQIYLLEILTCVERTFTECNVLAQRYRLQTADNR